ncbi:hypothetical protein [Nocardia alni]|uniref:hypothetical protein n=1 Tax=Nocardia alni TaxID=2815723 RepID=UPI001C24C895|nr:hypothetical protein [Nocardia alni]
MAGQVELFGVVDVGIGHRLVAAGGVSSREEGQDGGFGDLVLGGECGDGSAVLVRLDQFVDRAGGEPAFEALRGVGLFLGA